MKASSPVVIYNPDGVNPYGTEIAALLHEQGHDVVLVDACNSENRPPAGVSWRQLLPANFGAAPRWRQGVRLVRGLATTVLQGSVGGRVVLVASVQRPIENVVLAAVAASGRPVVHVQHDPVRRRAESRFSRWSRRQILQRATIAVVHAERLRTQLPLDSVRRVVVCPHPPYTVSAEPRESLQPSDDGRRWLAFIGALRPDKGVHLLPEILASVPEAQRRQLGLIVCGRGVLPQATWQRLEQLQITVRDMTSIEPVTHEALLGVLALQPVVLAPYVAATQSGSVILALTMGCRVIAFDQGGVPDVVTADGLVPNGDVHAFAAAVAAGRSGTSRLDLAVWSAEAGRAWSAAVAAAAAGRSAGAGT